MQESKIFLFITFFSIPHDPPSALCPSAPAIRKVTKGLSPTCKAQALGLKLTQKLDGSGEDSQRAADFRQLLHTMQNETGELIAGGCQRGKKQKSLKFWF